uniref:Hypotheticial protein n=1 Tax=Schistosoma japonicum TaxID=6182 RepID=C1LFZ2_SCHJA|nr:hypotheticial protein [Schistosoma japonicum]
MAKHFIKQFRFACVSFCTYYVVCILLGAPLFEQWKETGLMSLILTICTNLPFLMTFEGNLDNLRSVLAPSCCLYEFMDFGICYEQRASFLIIEFN